MYRVIIVEDSALLLKGMAYTLDWKSVECEIVGTAMDGIDGKDLIMEIKPDIVVTDVKMPGMSGLEMIKQAMSQGCQFSVIIISGYSDFEYAKSALSLGAVEYLIKPFEDEQVYEAVRTAIKRVDERRQLNHLQTRLNSIDSSKMSIFKSYIIRETDRKGEYTNQAIRYIEAHYAEDINVSTIAEALSISESHLSKVFKDTMRITLGDYLTQYRVTQACKLLQDLHIHIYEVAALCGYKDQRYFSVIFRRSMGMTPYEFRTSSMHNKKEE